MEISRHVVSLKLLGKEKNESKSKSEQAFAIEVLRSDESVYTIYRSKKQIAQFNHKLVNENSSTTIPNCPLKKTPFGIREATTSENTKLDRLLYTYFKSLSALPCEVTRSPAMIEFAALLSTDLEEENEKKERRKTVGRKIPKRNQSLRMTATRISKPMMYKSYVTIADYNSRRIRLRKDSVVQVLQKDPRGWWLVDFQGELGWAPASYLVLKDEEDEADEEEENEGLIRQDKIGARYISNNSYKASRDDEISFGSGVIVRIVKKYIDGWWLVKYNGREGFVPGMYFNKFDRRQATTYVKNIKRKYSQKKSTIISNNVRGSLRKYCNKENGETNDDTQSIIVYECVCKFTGREEKHELSLARGDLVKVLEQKDNGWWLVQDWHGRTGWAPSSFLKDVHDSFNGSESIRRKIGMECRVVSAFEAQTENELTIKEGDIVTVLLVSEDGWWRVCMFENPDEEGLVPSICLSDKIKKNKSPAASFNHSSGANSPNMGEIEVVSPSSVSSKAADKNDDIFDDSTEWVNPSDSDDIYDCYVVTQNYAKENHDEIDAMEGEIACVVDHTHKDTWYVEIDNREGWIPSSILKPITDEELNNSPEITPPPETKEETTTPVSPLVQTITHTRELRLSQSSYSTQRSHHLCVVSVSSDDVSSDNEDQEQIQQQEEEMEAVQKELEEAERLAQEANEKAATLRKKAEETRKTLERSYSTSSNSGMKRKTSVDRLV